MTQFQSAISSANAGDVITLAPGTYAINSKINVSRPGTSTNRITVRANNLGEVTFQTNTPEPINLSAAYWSFENLTFEGVCSNHSDCEHAFHIVGAADGTIIRNSILRDYNAQIKGNAATVNGVNRYPNNVLIENTAFYDRTGRVTENPVAKIDVVGGQNWIVRGNTFGDFFKDGGNGVSYGAFLKGNSSNGIFENNTVVCSKRHSGGARIGLSFGGGGSAPDSICENNTCGTEHRNGIMRNNVIINCSDVGIYINKGQGTQIYNNSLVQTNGIDVRYATSTATVRANLISGSINNREGGTSTSTENILNISAATFGTYFVNPLQGDFSLKNGAVFVDRGPSLPSVTTDACGQTRSGASDIGAIEYVSGTQCPSQIRAKYDRF